MLLESAVEVYNYRIRGSFTTSSPTTVFRSGLEKATVNYKIDDVSFKSSPELTFRIGVGLMTALELDPEFVRNPERNLFCLAIADEWISSKDPKARSALLDMLKLVATKEGSHGEFRTLSGVVRQQSQGGSEEGTLYDPQAPVSATDIEHYALIDDYCDWYEDPKLTLEAKKDAMVWGKGSLLHPVRTTLRLHPLSQKQFMISVLAITTKQLTDGLGYHGLYLPFGDEGHIILARDYQAGAFEHEYAHSQHRRPLHDSFFKGLILGGANEATTESSVKWPASYFHQRLVLNAILDSNPPHIERLLARALMGCNRSRRGFFSQVIRNFGLEGFLKFSRMSFGCLAGTQGELSASVLINPEEMEDFFWEKCDEA